MSSKTDSIIEALGAFDAETIRVSSVAIRTAVEEAFPNDPLIGEVVEELVKVRILSTAFSCPPAEVIDLIGRIRSQRAEH